MMQGCHTPPPPPHPMVSPLACQVGSCLVWPCCFVRPCCFPLWSCLASSPLPSPLWSGACGLFGWPRPACGGAVCSTDVWYGCCRLLVVMSSLRALSPPPLWGGACGRFGWPRPACVGQCVLQRYVWYGCCRLLAVMSSLRARYHTKLLFSPCKRCPCPCSDAVHSPSSPPSGLRGFVPVVRDRWEEQGRFGGPGAHRGPGRGGGGDTMGGVWGGGGVGARDPRAYIHTYIYGIYKYNF